VALPLVYRILVFVAALGVIQSAAAYNDLRGLLFFRRKLYAYIFGIITAGVPLGIFFRWNYMFATGIIAGTQQTGLFVVSVLAAIVMNLIMSSLINIGYYPQSAAPTTGLEALRESTFFRVIRERLTIKNND
jgi:hypothetical protein